MTGAPPVSQPTLRAATAADVPALSRLAIAAFVAKFGDLYRPEDLAAFLAEALGLTCGFPEHARGSRVMDLKQLYTAPQATGQGVGSALMDWAMAEFAARGADEVQLSVYAENHGAHRFYRRYGFDKVADITFRVGEQLDPEFLFALMF